MKKFLWPMVVIMCAAVIATGIHYGLQGKLQSPITPQYSPNPLSQQVEPRVDLHPATNRGSQNYGLVELARMARPAVVLIETFDREGNSLGCGTGFFISNQGHLITNYHVIEGAYKANIKTIAGQKYVMSAVQSKNEDTDTACLLVEPLPSNTPFLNLAEALPSVGEDIAVVGNPFGLESTVTDGIVSAFRDDPRYGTTLQISAPVSKGSSGGPVLNMKGEVVGVATFSISVVDPRKQALNFAIPCTTILELLRGHPMSPESYRQPRGTVTAVVHSRDNTSAIIDSYVVHQGETLYGVKVLTINRDRVEFEKDGERWTQRVQEPPSNRWK